MYTLGIDIGSTTSKCVIMKDGRDIVGKSIMTGGSGTKGPTGMMDNLWNNVSVTEDEIDYTVVTGYGRNNYSAKDDEVSELTCHALGARFLFDDARTIIDIGGQDAKVISLSESGKMQNFVMNDKCAAGTGRFMEVMAGILGIGIADFDEYASGSEKAASISSTCTVFAESEVISQLANGVCGEDIASGICESVAARVSALARRTGIREQVCMSGGVAGNGAVRRALSRSLGVDILYDPLAQYFGAIGAAMWAYRKANQ